MEGGINLHKLKQFALEKKELFIRVATIFGPLVMVLLLLSQPAFAKTTYVITDGSRVLVHTTNATDPEAVLAEAGLTLGADDTYTAQAGEGGSSINVRRSRTVRIDYYGEQLETESCGETVEQLLKRLNLSWRPDDAISMPLDTEVFDGMELRVANVIKQNQTYTTVLEHETVYCSDPSLPAGTEVVLTNGVDGQVRCEALVTYINGVESERTLLSERVVTQPVDEVVAVGCGDEAQTVSNTDGEVVIGDGLIYLPTGEVLTYTNTAQFRATAYTHTDAGCDLITATGTTVRWGTVAVDPEVIPYGTRMFIVTSDGSYIYGLATAEDCGSAIKADRLDLYMPTYAQCIAFGIQRCTVYFLGT